MSFLNFADPVTLVRSPTFTKFVDSSIVKGSRPLSRSAGFGAATTRGAMPRTAAASARVVSGVGPQQPPTMVTRPARAHSGGPAAADHVGQAGAGELGEHAGRELGRLVVATHVVRQAGVRIDADAMRSDLR